MHFSRKPYLILKSGYKNKSLIYQTQTCSQAIKYHRTSIIFTPSSKIKSHLSNSCVTYVSFSFPPFTVQPKQLYTVFNPNIKTTRATSNRGSNQTLVRQSICHSGCISGNLKITVEWCYRIGGVCMAAKLGYST